MGTPAFVKSTLLKEIVGRLEVAEIRKLAENPWMIRRMLQADLGNVDRAELERVLEASLMGGWYRALVRQVDRFRQVIDELELPFEQGLVDRLRGDIPVFEWRGVPKVSLTLTWTLGTPPETAKAKIRVLEQRFGIVSGWKEFNPDNLCNSGQGSEFQPYQVEWRRIRPLANWRSTQHPVFPRLVRGPLAGFEMFDQADQHPEAFMRQDGKNVPHWWLRALKLAVPDEEDYFIPWLGWEGRPVLRALPANARSYFSSVPEVQRLKLRQTQEEQPTAGVPEFLP